MSLGQASFLQPFGNKIDTKKQQQQQQQTWLTHQNANFVNFFFFLKNQGLLSLPSLKKKRWTFYLISDVETTDCHLKKDKTWSKPHTIHQSNSKWVREPNLENETKQVPEDNMYEFLYNLDMGKSFLTTTQNSEGKKKKKLTN